MQDLQGNGTNRPVSRKDNTKNEHEDADQRVFTPSDIFLLGGFGIFVIDGLASLSSDNAIEVWTSFVALKFPDRVALLAPCLEKSSPSLSVT